jgi:hypothetical protein
VTISLPSLTIGSEVALLLIVIVSVMPGANGANINPLGANVTNIYFWEQISKSNINFFVENVSNINFWEQMI